MSRAEDEFDRLRTTSAEGERHGPLEELCDRLHRIIVGRGAAELLADTDSLPEQAGVWVGPSWAWLHSRIDVGRKDRAMDGTRFRLPVRLQWLGGSVSLVPAGRRRRKEWLALGMGHSGAGSLLVGASETIRGPRTEEDEAGVPTEATMPMLSAHEQVRALEALVADGEGAKWEALLWLEPHIDHALTLAHANVSKEMSAQWGVWRPLLDDTKLKIIATQMLLGDDTHPGKVAQLLERCLQPETFYRVEPVMYIKDSLRRDANTEVRRSLGDPHVGPKVRRVAKELGTDDIEQIVDEYRRQYPADRLSTDRALAAMTVAPDAMAAWNTVFAEEGDEGI